MAWYAVGVVIFKHLNARRLVNSRFSLTLFNELCLNTLKYYFRYFSALRKETEEYFFVDYSIIDLIDDSLCAIVARIHYVQRTETRLTDLI